MCGHGERAAGAASEFERAGHRELVVFQGGPGDRSHATVSNLTTDSSAPAPPTDPGRCSWVFGRTSPSSTLLVAVNALVGGMYGQERIVLPLLAENEFGLTAYTGVLTFILAFSATKTTANSAAGTRSDRYGRKPVLVAGWLIALPVPLLIWAPS